MIAVPVKVLVIDAIRYRVPESGQRRLAMSLKPAPPNQASRSPCTIAAATPGSRCSRTNSVARAPSACETPSIGSIVFLLGRAETSGCAD
jgi:hypothetical protein